jgi:thioesterase domain-containing protein
MFRPAVLTRSAETAVYRTFLALGWRLPVFVRTRYIEDIYHRARRTYVPQTYSGPVTFFKGERRVYHPESDWGQMIAGHCEVHVVKAEHLQMREERYVPLWAGTLKRLLSQAQGDMPSRASAASGVGPPDHALLETTALAAGQDASSL